MITLIIVAAGVYVRWAFRPVVGAYSLGRRVGRITRK
jgi:hypothetical protein